MISYVDRKNLFPSLNFAILHTQRQTKRAGTTNRGIIAVSPRPIIFPPFLIRTDEMQVQPSVHNRCTREGGHLTVRTPCAPFFRLLQGQIETRYMSAPDSLTHKMPFLIHRRNTRCTFAQLLLPKYINNTGRSHCCS